MTRLLFSILAFLLVTPCYSQDTLSAAQQRLREIEQQKQAAKELAEAKAKAELEAQAPLVQQIELTLPEPTPDEISKPEPQILFSSPMKEADPKPVFRRYTATYCQPCKRMEAEGFDAKIRAAGYDLDVVDVTEKPVANVSTVPQVWLVHPDGTPIRRWIGYSTADNVLKPITVDGICKLTAWGTFWSGVAIGDNQILTCAHHFEDDSFYAQFPLSFGSEDYVQLKCTLVKTDKASDLCVLRFEPLAGVTVKTYPVATENPSANVVQGYFEGDKPKKYSVSLRAKERNKRGKRIDHYNGSGITQRQVGMSGGPLLNPAGQVVGIQSMGNDDGLIIASAHDAIVDFLKDVPAPDDGSYVIADVTNAPASVDTLAAVLSAHMVQSSGQQPEETPVYGSLFSFDVDVPESVKEIGAKLLTQQKLEFPAAGLSPYWTGQSRTFTISDKGVTITPSIKATVNKWFITWTCGLDGFTFEPDLSSVTILLSGAPDLKVNLK